jgi:hypothetical protein
MPNRPCIDEADGNTNINILPGPGLLTNTKIGGLPGCAAWEVSILGCLLSETSTNIFVCRLRCCPTAIGFEHQPILSHPLLIADSHNSLGSSWHSIKQCPLRRTPRSENEWNVFSAAQEGSKRRDESNDLSLSSTAVGILRGGHA